MNIDLVHLKRWAPLGAFALGLLGLLAQPRDAAQFVTLKTACGLSVVPVLGFIVVLFPKALPLTYGSVGVQPKRSMLLYGAVWLGVVWSMYWYGLWLKAETAREAAVNTQIVVSTLVSLTLACSTESSASPKEMAEGASMTQPERVDAGLKTPATAGNPAVAVHVCSPTDSATSPMLATIPSGPPKGPGIGFFRQKKSSCNRDPAQIVVQNEGTEPVQIDALGMDDARFSVEGPALPYTMAAGDILALKIAFDQTFDEARTTLSISTNTGCAQFPVKAMNVNPEEGSVITSSPFVLSFGRVKSGSESEPIAFTLITEPRQAAGAKASIGAIASSNASFRVETTSTAPVSSAAAAMGGAAECMRTSTLVKFVAPNAPGLVQGQLTWEVETDRGSVRGVADVVGLAEP